MTNNNAALWITADATELVSLESLSFEASSVPGERDTAKAIEGLLGEVAVYVTSDAEQLVGVIEAPLTGPASTGGYPIIRFADGKWGRTDDVIELVKAGAEDLDAIDALITAHEAGHELDPETCRECHVLFARRATANV